LVVEKQLPVHYDRQTKVHPW